MRTLEAGKHVLCEKPFSRRTEDVERAFDRAVGARPVRGLHVAAPPQARELARLVADGAIGRPALLRAAFSFPLAAVHGADDARFSAELDGGSLMDVGCYCLEVVGDEASLFVDDPLHIHAPGIELRREQGTERIEVERANSYRLELENVSDAIRGDAPLLLGREDALGQARAIEAPYRSAETAVPVTLEPTTARSMA